MIHVGPYRPRHLLPFDTYTVHVGNMREPGVQRTHLTLALQTAARFIRERRGKRVVICHPVYGVVAVVRPLGRDTVVIWKPDPHTADILRCDLCRFRLWVRFVGLDFDRPGHLGLKKRNVSQTAQIRF
jgi:hypothetical protein